MFKVLSAAADRDEWDSLIARLPPELQDVHFTSAYARVQASHYEGHPCLAYYKPVKGHDFVVQPFMMTPIGTTDYYDIASLYGYGGPIGTDPDLGAAYQQELWGWARSHYVVSELCRMHPLHLDLQKKLLDHVVLPYALIKEVVVIDLEGFSLKSVSTRVRRGVKKAMDAGCHVTECPNYWAFGNLYEQSMQRLGGALSWHYGLSYWQAHKHEDVGAQWFFVLKEEADAEAFVVSDRFPNRALLTVGKQGVAYAHFLGSNGGDRDLGLDPFLYYWVANDLKRQGFKRFHLGGGLTEDPTNSLLLFKSGFSDVRLVAERYGRVFDSLMYSDFCDRRAREEQEMHGRESTAQYFPAYRRPFR